ncbi:hypothetical protein [Streptomyces aurantiogriseus]|uniref:Uncharacterized protein n=1 Tax=Streptomyces aurantiogriseus TaxID=66870 RepID=A0A918FJQ7_9ACTN|nr:hypothetical protein [Streptomyces aurantiogriseus]GGR43203.1 hypothetical protein GCM10010251_70320 [Streptomyces aurantiogriseus]
MTGDFHVYARAHSGTALGRALLHALSRSGTALDGPLLYARSRTVPRALAALCATAGLALWGAHGAGASVDPERLVPVVALAPLFAAAVIGTSLHTESDELDRTAARPWWRWRAVHLLALTALAAALLSVVALGQPSGFGPSAMLRNTLGAAGLTAAAAAVLGSRLSWLPAFGYAGAVYLGAAGPQRHAATVWAWPVRPGDEPGAWAVALAAFAVGGALYVVRGARGEARA